MRELWSLEDCHRPKNKNFEEMVLVDLENSENCVAVLVPVAGGLLLDACCLLCVACCTVGRGKSTHPKTTLFLQRYALEDNPCAWCGRGAYFSLADKISEACYVCCRFLLQRSLRFCIDMNVMLLSGHRCLLLAMSAYFY